MKKLFLEVIDETLTITKECECGCGLHICDFNSNNKEARFVSGHNTRKRIWNPWIPCRCGCQILIRMYYKNQWNKRNYYFFGHQHNGKKQTRDRIENRRLKIIGKKRTQETKDKMRLSQLGKHHSEKTKLIKRMQRLKQRFPKHDTKPEKMLGLLLNINNIKYEKQKTLLSKTQVDFFIEPKICVYVDGCYWHYCQDKNCKTGQKNMRYEISNSQIFNLKRDQEINHLLNKNGYNVIRIWEHDITENNNETSKKIISLIVNTIQQRMVGGDV